MRSIPSLVKLLATKGLAAAYSEVLPDLSHGSVAWIETQKVPLNGARVLEVGCGYAGTSVLLRERGADPLAIDIELRRVQHGRAGGIAVALADAQRMPFPADVFDLIVCIGVLEHLPKPQRFVEEAHRCLRPGGFLYLTWTNWLSPLGGHDFAPFHYLGPKLGYAVARRVRRRKRFKVVPYENLWPVHIGPMLHAFEQTGFKIARLTPRHFASLTAICRVPIAREFLTVNCQALLQKPAVA